MTSGRFAAGKSMVILSKKGLQSETKEVDVLFSSARKK